MPGELMVVGELFGGEPLQGSQRIFQGGPGDIGRGHEGAERHWSIQNAVGLRILQGKVQTDGISGHLPAEQGMKKRCELFICTAGCKCSGKEGVRICRGWKDGIDQKNQYSQHDCYGEKDTMLSFAK